MANELEVRVARLESEVQLLRELLDELSLWVTGARASRERTGGNAA
jgi:uncharacterized coiled-coil protein SlyX